MEKKITITIVNGHSHMFTQGLSNEEIAGSLEIQKFLVLQNIAKAAIFKQSNTPFDEKKTIADTEMKRKAAPKKKPVVKKKK